MNKVSKLVNVKACCSILFLSLSGTAATASQTVTLSPTADARVRTDDNARRNDNYGCEPVLQLGTSRGGGNISYGGPDAIRTLINFDLTGVPNGSLSNAALEMSIYKFNLGTGSSVFTADVHRVIDSGTRTPWLEGNGSETTPFPAGCTNVDAAGGVAWENLDGNNQSQPDFDPIVVASAVLRQGVTPNGAVIRWDVTSMVRGWLEGVVPNFGLVLRDVTTDGSFREVYFASRELPLFPFLPQFAGPKLVLTFAPAYECIGFEPPMNAGPVSVKKNRALPFKAQLFDENKLPVTDATLAAPPIIQVMFTSVSGGPPVDVSGDALPVGLGTEGNRFTFTSDQKWQFNLKTDNYSAAGTYQVTMLSANSQEYSIQPTCSATFVKK